MRQTFYYRDELNDDFAWSSGRIQRIPITASYRYEHAFLWKVCSFFIYRLIILPVVYLAMKLFYGMRIRNRKALRKLDGGCFFYGNHTNGFPDAVLPAIMAFPRRAFVVAGAEAVSIPGIRTLVEMLGCIPLPDDLGGWRNYYNRLKGVTSRHAVMIYPEAHLWPYYNGIRHFKEASFGYPMKMHVPAVASVVTYRRRRILKNLPPHITVTLSDPYYPENFGNRKELRDAVYTFMRETVEREESYGYHTYLPADIL